MFPFLIYLILNQKPQSFPQVLMMPTGGVGIGNVSEFFAAGASAVAVGADIVSTQALKTGDYSQIEDKAREFRSTVLKVRQQQEHNHLL